MGGDAFDGSWKRRFGELCGGVDGGKIAHKSSAADRMKCELALRKFFQNEGCEIVLGL